MAEKFSIKTFFAEVKEELSKISWPTKEQTYKTTLVVMGLVVVVTIYLGIVDAGFGTAAAIIMG